MNMSGERGQQGGSMCSSPRPVMPGAGATQRESQRSPECGCRVTPGNEPLSPGGRDKMGDTLPRGSHKSSNVWSPRSGNSAPSAPSPTRADGWSSAVPWLFLYRYPSATSSSWIEQGARWQSSHWKLPINGVASSSCLSPACSG